MIISPSCSESHRSSHSHDDNGAIDPLNETHSCSSSASNDWRLDIRGNNLDCSPPPPVFDDIMITTAILNEHNRSNKLKNYDNKFTDSLSSHSNSRLSNHSNSRLSSLSSSHGMTREEPRLNSRLAMSESVYGKIYETRQLPNGLETTEV